MKIKLLYEKKRKKTAAKHFTIWSNVGMGIDMDHFELSAFNEMSKSGIEIKLIGKKC